MRPSHPALSALVKLHADLSYEMQENTKQNEKLTDDLRHVEAVIKLFAPSFDLRPIGIRRRKPNPWFKRRTVFRHAIDTLKTAMGPLTARQITLAMLDVKDVADADPKAVDDLVRGVQTSLRNNIGRTVRIVGEEKPMRWALLD